LQRTRLFSSFRSSSSLSSQTTTLNR
jgi:hypothetical protein